MMMQVIPGSERWYCRVEGCDQFTAGNVRYGRCGMHALERIGGAQQIDKFGFPPLVEAAEIANENAILYTQDTDVDRRETR